MVKEIVERAPRDRKDYEHKYRLLMPDGSVKHVHFVAHAIKDVRAWPRVRWRSDG